MTAESLSATTTVQSSADAVFAVLADPASHAAIDGTGWVCEPLNGERLTTVGQVFRMVMYHRRHPDGRYETANQVRELDPPHVITWATGTEDARGRLRFGGWTWRYDLAPAPTGGTRVRLAAEAEDLVQSALMRCLVHWAKVQHAEDRDAYVHRGLVNTLTSSRRRRGTG